MAVELNRCTFDPMLVKPKCVREAVDFFNYENCSQTSAVCLQFFKKSATSQTHFGFTNIEAEMHTSRLLAI